MKYFIAFVSLCLAVIATWAQEKPLDMKMDFEQYDPPSTLKVEEHKLKKSKFPFIDIHNHYGSMNTADLSERVKFMDLLNMGVMINLSGRGFRSSGDHLEKSFENIAKQYPNRFVLFTNVDFADIDNPEWSGRMAKQLEADVKRGAKGLKIYKNLGIHEKDSKGNRISIDDARISFGSEQSATLRLHRPEACYRAGGYQVRGTHGHVLTLAGQSVPVTQLQAEMPGRLEPITYWTLIGGELVSDPGSFRWHRLGFAARRKLLDGMLVRVSSINIEPTSAFELHGRFADDLMRAVAPDDRIRVIGRPSSR